MTAAAASRTPIVLLRRNTPHPVCDRECEDPAAAAPASAGPSRRIRGLAFDELGGPLVVVCGLHGGAGTSTLAHALATYAAASGRAPVLLCEGPGASGDHYTLGGPCSSISLAQVIATLAAGRRPQGTWWAQRENLRILATNPQRRSDNPPGGTAARSVLARLGAEHGLTVIDAGPLRDPDTHALLATATHVIWTLNATPAAGDIAQAALASNLLTALSARQAFALRAPRRRTAVGTAVRDVRRVAHSHHAERLVLIPDRPMLAQRPLDLSRQPLQRELASLANFLSS